MKIIGERYEVEAVLGRGNTAEVLRCRDRELDRPVAVKLLSGSSLLASPERFAAEAVLLARLKHEHIVGVFDHGFEGPFPFLVLELVDGGNLARRCRASPLSLEEATRHVTALASALAFAHREGVLHRDVKPENVLLDRQGLARLTDFGIAKFAHSGVRTHTGVIVGTPEYMAPEIFAGRAASPASDAYALGCLAYCLVNGHPPYTGNVLEVMEACTAGRWSPGKESGPLAEVVARCLLVDPGARLEVARIPGLLAGEGSSRRPTAPGALTVAVSSAEVVRRPLPPSAGATGGSGRPGRVAGVALLAGVLLTLGWSSTGPPSPTPPAPGAVPEATSSPAETDPSGAEALVEAWEARVRGLEPGTWIGDLQAGCDLHGEENYHEVMSRRRREGGLEEIGARLEAFAREHLPLRAAFAGEREVLGRTLVDPGVPFALRWRLFTALQELDHLDAYYVAWGLAPPYGVEPLLRRLVPIAELPLDEPPEPDVPRAEGAAVGPGRNLLFRWPESMHPSIRILVIGIEDAPMSEQMAWQAGTFAYGLDVDEHLVLLARFRLGEDLLARPGRTSLEAWIANHHLPNKLRVLVDDREIHYRASPARAGTGTLEQRERFQYRLRIELPRELLRAGENDLELRLMPLPGLRQQLCMQIDRVALVVEGP